MKRGEKDHFDHTVQSALCHARHLPACYRPASCHRPGVRDDSLFTIMEKSHQTNQPDQSAIRDAARHLYETTPATFDQVGEDVGVSGRTVKRWSAANGGWSKLSGPEITARAQAVADRIQTAVTDRGPQAGEDERQEVVAQIRTNAAVDQRAAILARHRSEWGIVRGLVAEAVRGRDAAKAKMAVDVGRALDLAQRGEARAWGLDSGENNQGAVTVVIERGA